MSCLFYTAYAVVALVSGYFWARSTFTGSHDNTASGALPTGKLGWALSTGAIYGLMWPLFAAILAVYYVNMALKRLGSPGYRIGTKLFGAPKR